MLADFRKEIQKGGVSPAGKAKTFYRFVGSHGTIIDVAYDDMKHAGKHNLTDEQIQAIEENNENFLAVYQETKRKGNYGGIPILAKIKTPIGEAGVVYEFLPNGRVFLKTMFFDKPAAIDNWMKKSGSSKSLLDESKYSSTGNRFSIQSIQKELGIVNAGSASSYLSQEEVRTQKEAVRKQYEGTAMWMKAPNGKDTNLTEEQWLLVRTPAFKAWFGDWEAANAAHEIRALVPIEVMLTGKSLDKKAAEEVFSTFGNVENPRYGTYATFPKGMVGKIIRHRGLDVSQMLSDLPRLFAGSVLAIVEPEYKKEGHKEHPNILAYHHYVNKFTANGTTYYIRFSLREERTKEPRKPSAKRILHSTGINDIQIYEENKKDASSQRIRVSDPGEESKTSFIDYRLAELFDSVNTASKIVDENGEPLVVYHGSDADFDVFDKTKGRANMDIQGMFFSPWEIDAQGYGGHVRAFFLNIKNPANEGQGYKALNRYAGQNYAGIKAREDLIANGYDGVNNDGEEFIAFEPTQIKSVDNNGNFDPEDANIYHQEAVRETAEERVNRISQEVFQTYLNDGIMKAVEETVAAEIGEYINLDAMADPVEKDKVRDSLPYIKALLVQFNSRTVQKNVDYKDRYAAKIEYARRCFDNDERIKVGVTRQMVGNEGQGDLHQNRNGAGPTEHKRGNGAAVQRLHGRISAGISNQVSGEKRGAREHFEKLYNETAKKHSENQGAFSHGLLDQSA